MGVLNYKIRQYPTATPGIAASPFAGRIVKTGTIPVSTTPSAPIAIPRVDELADTAIELRLIGVPPLYAYVEIFGPSQTASAPVRTHAVEDERPRILLRADDVVSIPVPANGKFAVVEAVAIP